MSTEGEVMKIGKKLEKMISSKTTDNANGKELLKTLKGIPMNLQALTKTRIGMTVNKFRKECKDEESITIAKSLIKSWKKLIDQPNNKSQSGSDKEASDSSSSSKKEPPPAPVEPETPPATKADTPTQHASSIIPSFPQRNTDTTDNVRLKCRELLTNALKSGTIPDGAHDPAQIAAEIEDCIYTEYVNTDTKYKNHIRSRVFNLKDKKNPMLRENVLLRAVTPEKLVTMTAEEMANDDMKAIRAKYTKEAIDDHAMAVTSGTQTDLLKCGKCGKRNCTYNQMQTRSADEPMTTFCYCMECGHRWKFC